MTTIEHPSLLLLPGLLCDARLWHHQAVGLADVADVSVADLSGADSIAELASLALSRAPPGRFALAGLSMGGYVALEIMRQAPERVLALALLDTSARPDTAEATGSRLKLMKLAETNFPAVIDTLLPKLIHPAHRNDAAIVDVIAAMANSLGKEAFRRQQRAMIGRIDSRAFLRLVQCPTLVLCGREDELTPVELHQELAAGIAGSNLVIVEECGHLSTLEQPLQVTAALRQWVSKLEP
ncbi:3-oxoadipate enol-lactonase 2 [compost metagenome]